MCCDCAHDDAADDDDSGGNDDDRSKRMSGHCDVAVFGGAGFGCLGAVAVAVVVDLNFKYTHNLCALTHVYSTCLQCRIIAIIFRTGTLTPLFAIWAFTLVSLRYALIVGFALFSTLTHT